MRVLAAIALLTACPGEGESTLPDESGDLSVGSTVASTSHLGGTQPVTPAVVGSQWSFVEAACTEGGVDLADLSRTMVVRGDDDGLLLVFDQTTGQCTETFAQHFSPGSNPTDEWAMREETRVRTGNCTHTPEASERPGDLRMRGQFMEVYVQRSARCNGLELKMVFAPAPPAEPDGQQILRHYAVHFNRQDARAVTELFADTGSLVEPFNRTPDDQPFRHDGRAQIFGWFQESFSNTPWLALRVIGIEPGETPGAFVMDWHYMDPRLDAPFGGRNRFTIAGGEIFEATLEITQQEIAVEGLQPEDEAAPAPEAEDADG